MQIIKNDDWASAEMRGESFHYLADDGDDVCRIGFTTRVSRFCGKDLPTISLGGAGTDPEYRRGGYLRTLLNEIHLLAPERGWAVSFMHPFSFSFYRRYGYERVADEKIVTFPLAKLDFLPRVPDLVPVNTPERAADCVKVYNAFADKRNIMFRRWGTASFPVNPDQFNGRHVYLWYDAAGQPAAYVWLEYDRYFYVQRMISNALHVKEYAFTSKESLAAILGFLRMFDGEDNTVKIHNTAMAPEVDLLLRHYMHTSYTLEPDISVRVLDVKQVLEANAYPLEPGHFTVAVDDYLDFTRGVWQVEYANGKAEATRLSADVDGKPADITAAAPAFAQLVYGYDEYTPDVAAFMEGVTVSNPASDFFKSFHKKPNGLFEHF